MRIKDTNIFYDCNGKKTLHVGGNIDFCFSSKENMTIEAPCYIVSNDKLNVNYVGAFTFINDNVHIRFVESMGRFCSIAPDVRIGMPNHPIESITTSDVLYDENKWGGMMTDFEYDDFMNCRKNVAKKTSNELSRIGNDVWIGQGAYVLKGVKIGDGAVVAAGAVVTKDVAPYTVVGGVPAKEIKKRFSDEIIDKLLELKWWEYGPDILCGIDVTDVTMESLCEIEKRIINGFPRFRAIEYCFIQKDKIVSKVENEKEYVIYDEAVSEIKYGGISNKQAHYNAFTGKFNIFGWFLPTYAYDDVEIYVKDVFIGCAQNRVLRPDVLNNFGKYGDVKSGWKFEKILKAYNGECVSIKCKKNNKVIHSLENIPCEMVTPYKLIEKYSMDFDGDYMIKKGEEVSILTDDAGIELEKLFSKSYKVTKKSDSQIVIVCTANWEEDINNLEKKSIKGIPFWMWLIFKKNMISYERLKEISAMMDVPVSKLLGWIKLKLNVKIGLVYGNCQNMSINTLITSSIKLMKKYILIDMLPVQDIKGDEKKVGFSADFIQSIDLLIYQNVSENNKFSPKLATAHILKNINENAKTICIPNVYFSGYFPQACGNPYNPFLKEYNNTPFPYGDINIQEMQDEYSAREIAYKIGAKDFYSKEYVEKNANDSLQELINREQICDVKISDYILDNYKKEMLFFTTNHPSNKVLKELVKRVFNLCDEIVDDIDESKAWENNGREIFIYPSVFQGLGLEFDKDKFCWWNVIKKEPSDIYEYVEDYLKYCKKPISEE